MDSKWPKYIKRDLRKHFSADTGDLEFHATGERRKQEESKKKLELFVNNLIVKEGAYNYFFLEVNVNLLITLITQETNIYDLDTYKGQIAAAFDVTIPVLDDSNVTIGCLIRKTPIHTTDYGEKQPDVLQVSLDAYYRLEIDNGGY